MTLKELLETVSKNEAIDIAGCYDRRGQVKGGVDDNLVRFVINEIGLAYDEDEGDWEQLRSAAHVIEDAVNTLTDLAEFLGDEADECYENEEEEA